MKNQSAATENFEIYETHIMSELAVIFHTDRVEKRDTRFLNWHENIEILFFKEGEATVYHNGETTEARAGDILIFSANCIHGVTADQTLYDCLILDRGFCLSAGVDTSALSFPTLVRDETLTALYRKVAETVEKGDSRYRVCAVRGAVLSLLAYLCRNYAIEDTDREPRSLEGIKKVLRYIREHIAEPLSMDDLAAVAGFSKFHFAREFKRVTSYTVVTYLNIVRIEKAKSMLAVGGVSVKEAALASGYNNLSYFSKIFFEHTGMTPSKFVAARR